MHTDPPVSSSRPIGLFDSGIGGLTVARRVMDLMPQENTVYFGDTARVPYGSKSSRAVIEYSLEAAAFLQSLGVKLIVIACNTASAVALDHVRSAASVPVIGVIQPGADAAADATRNGRIGVIGTEGTVRSEAYQRALLARNPTLSVVAHPCPLFVGLAEEGLDGHPATMLLAREYLEPLLRASIDALILGCTHYPILHETIAAVAGDRVTLVDPGLATADAVRGELTRLGLINQSATTARHSYYLSDFPHKFIEVGERFLGRHLHDVHRITLDELQYPGHD